MYKAEVRINIQFLVTLISIKLKIIGKHQISNET